MCNRPNRIHASRASGFITSQSNSGLVIGSQLPYTTFERTFELRWGLEGFMGSPSTATRVSARRHRAAPASATRFDKRLAEILTHATDVFCEKGYEGASMRDLSRATGMSLAGLYYYFESKEKLLYLIQKHTFSTIVEQLRERLEGVVDAEERIRIFIHNHVEYFLTNHSAMKVLSHEDES